jgi:hypothetical protein
VHVGGGPGVAVDSPVAAFLLLDHAPVTPRMLSPSIETIASVGLLMI